MNSPAKRTALYRPCPCCDGAGYHWNPDEGNGPDTLPCRKCHTSGFVEVGFTLEDVAAVAPALVKDKE